MLSIYPNANTYIRSFVISIINVLMLISLEGAYAEHMLNLTPDHFKYHLGCLYC
jgi:hypothetical protein